VFKSAKIESIIKNVIRKDRVKGMHIKGGSYKENIVLIMPFAISMKVLKCGCARLGARQ